MNFLFNGEKFEEVKMEEINESMSIHVNATVKICQVKAELWSSVKNIKNQVFFNVSIRNKRKFTLMKTLF